MRYYGTQYILPGVSIIRGPPTALTNSDFCFPRNVPMGKIHYYILKYTNNE